MNKFIPVLYMIGVLVLIFPAFLNSNSRLKVFLKNISVSAIIVLIILTIIYFFK